MIASQVIPHLRDRLRIMRVPSGAIGAKHRRLVRACKRYAADLLSIDYLDLTILPISTLNRESEIQKHKGRSIIIFDVESANNFHWMWYGYTHEALIIFTYVEMMIRTAESLFINDHEEQAAIISEVAHFQLWTYAHHIDVTSPGFIRRPRYISDELASDFACLCDLSCIFELGHEIAHYALRELGGSLPFLQYLHRFVVRHAKSLARDETGEYFQSEFLEPDIEFKIDANGRIDTMASRASRYAQRLGHFEEAFCQEVMCDFFALLLVTRYCIEEKLAPHMAFEFLEHIHLFMEIDSRIRGFGRLIDNILQHRPLVFPASAYSGRRKLLPALLCELIAQRVKVPKPIAQFWSESQLIRGFYRNKDMQLIGSDMQLIGDLERRAYIDTYSKGSLELIHAKLEELQISRAPSVLVNSYNAFAAPIHVPSFLFDEALLYSIGDLGRAPREKYLIASAHTFSSLFRHLRALRPANTGQYYLKRMRKQNTAAKLLTLRTPRLRYVDQFVDWPPFRSQGV